MVQQMMGNAGRAISILADPHPFFRTEDDVLPGFYPIPGRFSPPSIPFTLD